MSEQPSETAPDERVAEFAAASATEQAAPSGATAADGEAVELETADGEAVDVEAPGAEADGAEADGAEADGAETDGAEEARHEETPDAPNDAVPPGGDAHGGEAADDDSAAQASLELADPARLRGALEAVLLVVDEPVSAVALAQTLAVPPPDVEAGLAALREEYDRETRGIDLREVAGGWRMYSREDYAEHVERFVLDGQRTRLTQAALETLAVIAYRQPVARSRVSAIRGVGVDGVMRTLITRGLIVESGADPESGAGLFVTTPLFLEKLGLNSLDELPPLGPLLPDHTDLDAEQDVDTDLVRVAAKPAETGADQPAIEVSADD